MTEIFDELAGIGSKVDEEDKVVYILASLLKDFNILVTVLEAHPEISKWEIVVERILNTERKLEYKTSKEPKKGLAIGSGRLLKCFGCGKPGHKKRDCYQIKNFTGHFPHGLKKGHKINKVTPYKFWNGKKPDLTNLRRIGDVVMFLYLESRQKLDFKSKRMVLLGYGGQVKGLNENYCDPELVKKVIVIENSNDEANSEDDIGYRSPHKIEDSEQELRRTTREKKQPDLFREKAYVLHEDLRFYKAQM
ncbi:uncharacterized protein [Lepeophtheirus salmonis]|uniref:uncharacterized protein n=1 Tax=Lepeophtheirus salmonis TaxID=72036 RepID=UPI001AE32A64|nr:uncharacterized protein LOC121121945 [Lepeophtheirus salmonis]